MAEIFGWICFTLNIIFYLSFLIPFYKLTRENITFLESPFILVLMTFLSSLFNGIYGLIKKSEIFWISNFIGSFITFIFIIIFFIFISNQKLLKSQLFNIIFLGIIIFIFYISYTSGNINIIKNIGIIFKSLMYISLNEKIYTVYYYSNKYQLIPIFSAICGLVCSIFWLIYCIFPNNKNNYNIIPYIFGIIFSIIQIYFYYNFSKKDVNKNDKKSLIISEIQSFPNN